MKLNKKAMERQETIALKREEAALEAERIRREKLAEQKKRQEEMREKALMLLAKSPTTTPDIVTTKKDATDEISRVLRRAPHAVDVRHDRVGSTAWRFTKVHGVRRSHSSTASARPRAAIGLAWLCVIRSEGCAVVSASIRSRDSRCRGAASSLFSSRH